MGSEMCIRDRNSPAAAPTRGRPRDPPRRRRSAASPGPPRPRGHPIRASPALRPDDTACKPETHRRARQRHSRRTACAAPWGSSPGNSGGNRSPSRSPPCRTPRRSGNPDWRRYRGTRLAPRPRHRSARGNAAWGSWDPFCGATSVQTSRNATWRLIGLTGLINPQVASNLVEWSRSRSSLTVLTGMGSRRRQCSMRSVFRSATLCKTIR